MSDPTPKPYGAGSKPPLSVGTEHIARLFSQLWTDGKQPDVYAFVDEHGPMTPDRLIAILEVDLRERWQLGECPPVESYLEKYPNLSEDPRTFWLVVAELFLSESQANPIDPKTMAIRFPQFANELAELKEKLAGRRRQKSDVTTPPPDVTMESEEAITIRLRGGTYYAPTPPEFGPLSPLLPPEIKRRDGGDDRTALPTPQQIGHYEVERILSHGGMGIIYKATDTRLKRHVALKMILSGSHADAATLARFRCEAEAVARLQHPNIVQIFEVGEHDGLPYLALEYVEGNNLQRILGGREYNPSEAAELVRTLALAVEFAHHHGIIHRDLKPGNILITPRGLVKITDFGLAKLRGSQDTHTRPGEVIGTPNYMAPEQAEGDPDRVGPAADIYSLGAVLYELLTGQPPFYGMSPIETLLRLRLKKPIPPRQFKPRIPVDLEQICLKCLEKDRHDRYPTAEALAADLQRFVEGRPISAREVKPGERVWKWILRHPAIAGLAFLLFATLTIFQIVFLIQWRRVHSGRVEIAQKSADLQQLRSSLEAKQQETQLAQERANKALRDAQWASYLSTLNQAEREFATHGAAKARSLLDQCNPDFRSWEWHYMRRRVEGSAVTRSARPGERLDVRIGADSQTSYSVSAEGLIVVRSLDSGEELAPIRLRSLADSTDAVRLIHRASFSPSGRFLVADALFGMPDGLAQHRIGMWDTATGKLLKSWSMPDATPLKFVFHSNENQFVLVSGNYFNQRGRTEWLGGKVQLFGLVSTDPIWTISTAPNALSHLDGAFMANGRFVLVGSGRNLTFLDATNGRVVETTELATIRPEKVCAHPSEPILVVSEAHSLHILDNAGTQLGQLTGHVGLISNLVMNSDGRHLVTCSTDNTIRVWDLPSRKASAILVGHTATTLCAALGPRHRQVASLGSDGLMKVWHLNEELPPSLNTACIRDWTPSVQFDPNNQWLASCSGDGQVIIWSMNNGQRLASHRLPATLMAMAVSPDGKLLAIATEKKEVIFLNPMNGQVLRRLAPDQPVLNLCFCAEGNFLLTTGEEGLAVVWDLHTGQPLSRFVGHTGSVTAGAISPNRNLVATGGADGVVHIWNPHTGDKLGSISAHTTQVSCLVFSPDGKMMATANQVRGRATEAVVIHLWDVERQKLVHTLRGHEQSVWCLAFHPDGTRLVSGSEDKTVKVWEPFHGQSLLTLKGHADDVRCLAFSRDGRILASSNDDPLIRLWEATPASESRSLQAKFFIP